MPGNVLNSVGVFNCSKLTTRLVVDNELDKRVSASQWLEKTKNQDLGEADKEESVDDVLEHDKRDKSKHLRTNKRRKVEKETGII